jgi:hypothetical protein
VNSIGTSRHFSQELACSDVARALVPAGVPPGPGTRADASFDTVSQPRTRVEMPGTGPQTGSLDTAGRVPAPHRLAECEKVGLAAPAVRASASAAAVGSAATTAVEATTATTGRAPSLGRSGAIPAAAVRWAGAIAGHAAASAGVATIGRSGAIPAAAVRWGGAIAGHAAASAVVAAVGRRGAVRTAAAVGRIGARTRL